MIDKKTNRKRYILLVLGFIVMLFAGVAYAWSIFKAPLMDEFGWSIGQLAVNYFLTQSFFSIGSISCGFFSKKLGTRNTYHMGMILSFLGFFLSSKLDGSAIWPLFITYGVILGLGVGFIYSVTIATISKWFPDKSGVCSGALMSGYGMSTLVLGKVAGILIDMPAIGWRKTYVIMAVSLAIMFLVMGFVIKAPGEKDNLPVHASVKNKRNVRDYSVKEALTSAHFYRFLIYSVLILMVGNSVFSIAKDILVHAGASSSVAVTLVGIVSLLGCITRVTNGAFLDRYGIKKTMTLTSCGNILAAGVLLISFLTGSYVITVIGMLLVGLVYGLLPSLIPYYPAEYFGTKNNSLIFPFITTNMIFSSGITTVITAQIPKMGYIIPFTIVFLLAASSLIVVFLLKDPD